ncbi:hypothetical protein [Pediococcus claussenii]|uniref:Extracellular protein n=1 Tax=Pediococcus claussenii (strain ATCC BAA-344 / DSM 14800 / JCM 18046 / KCTC 3811 / LMG 21948 / P06) TaxID=701521 RepID=G8PEC0_PEDCP|nr:hypothetical protein [Pediococcus claussenii]AEV94381.1 hypothetical protein PECL_46 [Pediococcus claussenii ATCC BAA-344]ANZ69602.1 hypothetical protein AYR57_04410 [Pediococcus claussenii]ANZ71419.1 hypothetical protein AYR58_04415 [Pediococcus claussenii]
MKKISVVTMAAAVALGVAAPISTNVFGQNSEVHAATKTATYSYVSNTSNSVSVTGMKKGSVVTLVNSKGQVITSQTVKSNGTLTFYLNAAQLQKVTAKDSLNVGNIYSISFNFIGYRNANSNTVTGSKTSVVNPSKTTNSNQTKRTIKTTTKRSTNKKAPIYSYVTNTASSITVTNMKRGAMVTLSNGKGQLIASQSVKSNGSLTFKLTRAQLKKVTSKDMLTVATGNYSYKINFNFIK